VGLPRILNRRRLDEMWWVRTVALVVRDEEVMTKLRGALHNAPPHREQPLDPMRLLQLRLDSPDEHRSLAIDVFLRLEYLATQRNGPQTLVVLDRCARILRSLVPTFDVSIDTLHKSVPISVDAHDLRIAHRCVTVTCANCKVGRRIWRAACGTTSRRWALATSTS